MRTHRFLLPAIIIFIILGCERKDTLEKQAVEASILGVVRDQQAAWNAGDLEGFMAGYQQSDSTSFVGSQGPIYGWGTVLERYRTAYPDSAAMGRLEFTDLDVTVISSDAALVLGKWMLHRTDDQPWGWFTLLFRRTSVGWRVVHDHTSSAE